MLWEKNIEEKQNKMFAWQKLMRYFYKKGKTQQVNTGKILGAIKDIRFF